jgi:membrane protease subunit HflK
VVGRNDQQAILEAGRIKIAEDTRVIMQRTLDQYGAGIEVRSVNITDVQVPEAVQQAQRDSVKAKADRERMIKEAQAYANGILPKAEGNAARAVQEAEAYKSQVVSLATGDASRFTALALAYEKAPAVTRERLYIETVESVLRASRKVVIDPKSGNGNMLYLPLDKIMDRNRESEANTITVRPAGDGGRRHGACRCAPEGGNADGLAHTRNIGGAAGGGVAHLELYFHGRRTGARGARAGCRRSRARPSSPACSSRSHSWIAWRSSTAVCSRASSMANSS